MNDRIERSPARVFTEIYRCAQCVGGTLNSNDVTCVTDGNYMHECDSCRNREYIPGGVRFPRTVIEP